MSKIEYLGDSKEVSLDYTGLLWIRQVFSNGRSISMRMDDVVLREFLKYIRENKTDLFNSLLVQQTLDSLEE